jgi:hypothetical protein
MKHKAISHRTLPVNDFRLPTLGHRQNAIFVDAGVDTLLPRGTPPMLVFGLENRYRASGNVGTQRPSTSLVFPSTVIGVKMGAHYKVHGLRRHSRSRQPLDKRQIELIKARDARPVLVITGTTVDQNRMVTGPQHPRGMLEISRPSPSSEHAGTISARCCCRIAGSQSGNIGREIRSTLLDNLGHRYFADRMTHRDQLKRSTGFSTAQAADASIAALTSVKPKGVINLSTGNFPA